jgi:hypothetical protein
MRNGRITSILALLATFGFSAAILAQNGKKAEGGKGGDLSGVWGSGSWATLGSNSPKTGSMQKNPEVARALSAGDRFFTTWGKQQYEYNRDQFVPPEGGERGRHELDPMTHCFPAGPTRLMSDQNPFEIIQSSRRVMIFSETNHEVRQIWMDGRKHPNDIDVTWNGDSIGHWEGDALVADTVGFHEETWLDGAGRGHSDKLHLIERFRRVDHDTLFIDVTIDDPTAYTKPFTYQIVRKLRTDWDIAETVTCDERYRKGIYGGEGPGGL